MGTSFNSFKLGNGRDPGIKSLTASLHRSSAVDRYAAERKNTSWMVDLLATRAIAQSMYRLSGTTPTH